MKTVQPLLLFFTDDSCLLSVMFLYETIFFYEGGHSIAHSIFKTCLNFFKRMKPAYILDIKYTVNFARKISLIASDDWV